MPSSAGVIASACTREFGSAEQKRMPTVLASGKSSLRTLACSSSGTRSEVPEMFVPVLPFQLSISSAEA